MDSIQKQIWLKSKREKVWRAISDSREFGLWFGMKFDGPFRANTKMRGTIAMITVDPEIAKHQQPHVGKTFEIEIDRVEPPSLFSFKWHPYAVDPNLDYSLEPMTLVTFELEDQDGGTLLTITESGFEKLSPHRRAEAIKMNEGGWQAQTGLIEKYLRIHG